MCYPEFPNLGRFFQIGGGKPGSSFMNVSRSTLQKLPAVNYYHKAMLDVAAVLDLALH